MILYNLSFTNYTNFFTNYTNISLYDRKKEPLPLFSALFFILKKYYLTISYLLVGICKNGVSHALNKWRIEIKR